MPRTSRPPRPLRLQPRDLLILAQLGELGQATTEQLWRLFWEPGTTIRACQERLKRFADHGLTKSFELDVRFAGQHAGRQPTLHALTPKGAEVVEQHTGIAPRRVLRKDLKPTTFHHRCEVIETRLVWDEGCQRSGLPDPLWVHEQDCRPDVPDGTAPVDYRVLFHAFGAKGRRVTCRPDAATLTVVPAPTPDDPSKTVQLVTWWERDRGTEGLLQIRRKVPGYEAAFHHRVFRHYGWGELREPVVRVLWVCQDKLRMKFLRETLASYDVAQYFRFTTRRLLDPKTILTERVWTDVHGRQRSILRQPAVSTGATPPE